MIKKLVLSVFFCGLIFIGFSQSNAENNSTSLFDRKNSETEKAVNYFIKSETTKLVELFPNYKKYISILNIIKLYSKSKSFRMRSNYLTNMQGKKTLTVLAMNNTKNETVDFLITFTSNNIDSKIESIKKYNAFYKPIKKDEIIEIIGD